MKVSTFLFVHDMFFFFRGNQSDIFSYLLYGSDWLFSCNDRALLAWCPRHILSVFIVNLIVDILMDIYVMVKMGIHLPVSPECIAGSSVQLIEMTCFLKLSVDQLLVLIDGRLRSIMKRPYNK